MKQKLETGRKKALDAAIAGVRKNFGNGSIMRLGEKPIEKVSAISSGSKKLDEALGIGGFPKGRIIEIFGPESSGKTTLALHAVAKAQKQDGVAVFIDAEHAFDPIYAENIGINTSELIVSQPSSGEEALRIAEQMIRSGAVDIVVIDSVAALVPEAEIKGEIGDSFVGVQARMMSQALRRLTGLISKTNCAAIFINQIREKVGVRFGNPETTPGGRALKFYSSVRLDIRRVASIKEGEENIGNRVRTKIVKNKVAPPFKKVTFDIYFGKGICPYSEAFSIGLEKNIIKKAGSWYSINEKKLGQGKENCISILKQENNLYKDLLESIA
ncbi:MAG: recombinase RecA [Candidatus Muiribacterium halophilum]|uniref:Protein RecA n=1 Tax=Muiribacterium halophilum TaxID=2053465 RepID=A0A2N5ZGE7_MUIH1|nr:MAG: recombinase RecA [Candidatus Muirbacterium halophilum]